MRVGGPGVMRLDEFRSGLVGLLIIVSRAVQAAETEIPLPSVSLDDRTAAAIDRGLARTRRGWRSARAPRRAGQEVHREPRQLRVQCAVLSSSVPARSRERYAAYPNVRSRFLRVISSSTPRSTSTLTAFAAVGLVVRRSRATLPKDTIG